MVLKNTRFKFKYSLLILFFFSVSLVHSQHASEVIKGKVYGIGQNGKKTALPKANIYLKSTKIATTSNTDGFFEIKKPSNPDFLIASFVGYISDTINTKDLSIAEFVLTESVELNEINIVSRKKGIETDYLNPLGVKKIGEKELNKAACCNLSESFETNPSVDASFTDAISGTRQIMMLGLAGPYTQITRENMPGIRGLSSLYGLTFLPGTWINGIQLIKGTGSVVNGFESIAGQINVELKRPANMEKLYLNLYSNNAGRIEANANIKLKEKGNWISGILLHASKNLIKHDKNNDNFLDKPLMTQYVSLNRWEYRNNSGIHLELGGKGTYVDKTGGEINFNKKLDEGTNNAWGMFVESKKLDGWLKLGKVNDVKPYQSFGIQLSGSYYKQNSFFGLNNYLASQKSAYLNTIFQSIIKNTNHKYKTGLSFQYDDYKERLNLMNFDRNEIVPGAFFEYTYSYLEKFNFVSGIRIDNHNSFGTFITPRLHIRYSPSENTVIRLSAGRGQKTANIISENTGILASSREIILLNDPLSKNPYGLKPEIAWNYGININQHFTLDYRNGMVSVDFYRTDFLNQIVLDLDKSPQQALFYNLIGKSYSNSFQAQFDYELIKRLDFRLAYRWFDVKTSYGDSLKPKPLVSSHRAFANLGYETRKYWRFDYTLNWHGSKRIPTTISNPKEYQAKENSPYFFTMNMQISKSWQKLFEVYLGVENLFDFKQENPIIASEQAFSPYFDSSLIWGPIYGRSFYLGLRYKIR